MLHAITKGPKVLISLSAVPKSRHNIMKAQPPKSFSLGANYVACCLHRGHHRAPSVDDVLFSFS
jgi:hypothetical protein